MHLDIILLSSFNDIPLDEVENVRTKLNEVLADANHTQIKEFEFDGPEDIFVWFEDGNVNVISHETTMSELLDELSIAV